MPKKPASHSEINPPEGWKDGEGFGFLYGHDAQGQPVDLVRLSDLVRWLQTSRRIARREALQAIIDALPDDAMQSLYKLRPGDAAALVSADEAFGQTTPESLAAAKETAAANARNQAPVYGDAEWLLRGFSRDW